MADKDKDKDKGTTKSSPDVFVDIGIAALLALAVLYFLQSYLGNIISVYQNTLNRFSFLGGNTIVIIFSIIDFLLMVFVGFTLWRFSQLRKRAQEESIIASHQVSPEEEVYKGISRVKGLMNSSNPSDWNMAVLEADALLDDALQHLGYEGDSVTERLKIVDPTVIKSLDRVFSAHRLRNMIAHEPLAQHPKEMIIHAIQSYEAVLQELGVMK